MEIKFVDLNKQYSSIKKEIDTEIEKVLTKGDFILGNAVSQFEQNYAGYCGCKYAVGLDSGTRALEFALQILGIGIGDEVLTVGNTFIATALAISGAGAEVKLIDVTPETQLMDVTQIEKNITPKTKAIIPVHLFGQMTNMKSILEIAKKHRLFVIEDACQAHGAKQDDQPAGSFGDLSCFSFYPGKNLGAYGDAGMITTNNKDYYERLMMLRNYGSKKKYYHEFKGTNARLDTLQAAILNVKLKYLDSWNALRNKFADRLIAKLKGVGDIVLPYVESNNFSAYHLFVIQTASRDQLSKHLNENGIQTGIHYPVPIHFQNAYPELHGLKGKLPVSEKLSSQILSLPMHPNLTDEEIDWIVEKVRVFFN